MDIRDCDGTLLTFGNPVLWRIDGTAWGVSDRKGILLSWDGLFLTLKAKDHDPTVIKKYRHNVRLAWPEELIMDEGL